MDNVLRGEEVRKALENGAVLYRNHGNGRCTYYWLDSRTFPVPTPVVEDMVISRTLDKNDPEYDELDEIGDELGYFITNYGSLDYLIYRPAYKEVEFKKEETEKMDEVRTVKESRKKKYTLEELCQELLPLLVTYKMAIVCKGPHGRRVIIRTHATDAPVPSYDLEYRCPHRDGQIIMFGSPYLDVSNKVDVYWWSAEQCNGAGRKRISPVQIDWKACEWIIDKESLNSSFERVKEEFEALKEVYETMEQLVNPK